MGRKNDDTRKRKERMGEVINVGIIYKSFG